MRIHIITYPNKEEVSFNYQPLLTGAIHKWIGENEFHDGISLYSFSWLNNGEASRTGLKFPAGSHFFISAYHPDFLKRIVNGIQNDPVIFNNLEVKEVIIQEDPEFNDGAKFYCASPIFIKRTVNNSEIHYTYKDKASNQHLTDTLKTKLKSAVLTIENVSVQFDPTYPNSKTKVIYYNKIGNKVNICPVILKGSPEQIAFAWNVGIGNSTGIGFGALN